MAKGGWQRDGGEEKSSVLKSGRAVLWGHIMGHPKRGCNKVIIIILWTFHLIRPRWMKSLQMTPAGVDSKRSKS